ncbi:hypothetical protein PIB30_092829, partial [Stylosanthes scabra]|nr:hypothetical protein [Stylosanthes scabra]
GASEVELVAISPEVWAKCFMVKPVPISRRPGETCRGPFRLGQGRVGQSAHARGELGAALPSAHYL